MVDESKSIRFARITSLVLMAICSMLFAGGALILITGSPPNPTSRPPPSKALQWIGIGVLLLAAGAAAWMVVRLSRPAPQRPEPFVAQKPPAIVQVIVWLVLVAALCWFHPAALSWIATIFFVVVFAGPLVLLHEASHALVGIAVGLRLLGVRIGGGKLLWRKNIRGIDVQIRPIPREGAAFLFPASPNGARPRLFLAIAAGPLFHAVVFAAMLVFHLFPYKPSGGAASFLAAAAVNGFFIMNALLLFLGAAPFYGSVGGMTVSTDMLLLIDLARGRPVPIHDLRVSRLLMEVMFQIEQQQWPDAIKGTTEALEIEPDNMEARLNLSVALIESGDLPRAKEVLLPLLDRGDLTPVMRALTLNNIAYADLMFDSPELLDEADRFSAEAIKILKRIPAVLGTRGAVLVERGQFKEGQKLLRRSFACSRNKRSRAGNLCYIALAHARQGQTTQATKAFETAGKLAPGLPLLERMMKHATQETQSS